MWRRLHTDQEARLGLDAADVRLKNVEVGVALVMAGVEVHVGDARLRAGRLHHLYHFLHRLLSGIIHTQIEPDGTEVTVGFFRRHPVVADFCGIHTEVGALQRAHSRHGFAGRGGVVVPGGAGRQGDRGHELAVAEQAQTIPLGLELVRRLLCKRLQHRHVGPEASWQDYLET